MAINQYSLLPEGLVDGMDDLAKSAAMHAGGTHALDLLVPENAGDVLPVFGYVHAADSTAFEWVPDFLPNRLVTEDTKILIKRVFVETRVIFMPAQTELKVWVRNAHFNLRSDASGAIEVVSCGPKS